LASFIENYSIISFQFLISLINLSFSIFAIISSLDFYIIYRWCRCTGGDGKKKPPANIKLNNAGSINYVIKNTLNKHIVRNNKHSHCFIVADTENLNTTKNILKRLPNVTIIIVERNPLVFDEQIKEIKKLKENFSNANIIHIHSDIFKAIEFLSDPRSKIDISNAVAYFDIYGGTPDESINKILEEKEIKAYFCHSTGDIKSSLKFFNA